MKKTLQYCRTNGYDYITSKERRNSKTIRVLTQTKEFPYMPDSKAAFAFLNNVTDDSGWEKYKEFNNNTDITIIAEIRKEL